MGPILAGLSRVMREKTKNQCGIFPAHSWTQNVSPRPALDQFRCLERIPARGPFSIEWQSKRIHKKWKEDEISTAPRVISKTFQYQNDLKWKFEWVGNIASEGKPTLQISTPPAFQGEVGDWTPEDLFEAAANACMLLTFLAYVEREHIVMTSYESTATGTVERVGEKCQFTAITRRFRIELADSSYAPQVEESLRKAA